MRQTWWERWRQRITGAWAVLTGRAWAGYYDDQRLAAKYTESGHGV